MHDKYGGIERGTIFVRNFNMNEGARRADIDRIYDRMKPIVLESDVHLSCDMSVKPVQGVQELVEVNIIFSFHNYGDAIATDTYVVVEFTNIEKIVKCNKPWSDISVANQGRPVVSRIETRPIVKTITFETRSFAVQVKKEVKEINAKIVVGASNMRTRIGMCKFPVVEGPTGEVF